MKEKVTCKTFLCELKESLKQSNQARSIKTHERLLWDTFGPRGDKFERFSMPKLQLVLSGRKLN